MSNCCIRRSAKFHVDSAVRFCGIANIREGGVKHPPPPGQARVNYESSRSRKKTAFFAFHRLVPPTGKMGETKRVRSDRMDMTNFLASVLDLYPPPISL